MDIDKLVAEQFSGSIDAKQQAAAAMSANIARAAALICDRLEAGNKILACGNGGSAADAQHFSAELLNRFETERRPLPAVALTTDTSTLTAIANDYSFAEIFAKQVSALGSRHDLLLAISTSGNSDNVLAAIRSAHERDMQVVAMTGRDGGLIAAALRDKDIELRVPHDRTARIQEVHLLTIHALCAVVDAHFA